MGLSGLNNKQLRAWAKDREKERLTDLLKSVILNPVVTLVGAFVAIDYFEQKTWGESENTMLGPVAANVIRTGLVAGPVMDALGKIASIAGPIIAAKSLGSGT